MALRKQFLKEVSYGQQGCKILYKFKTTVFYLNVFSNVIYVKSPWCVDSLSVQRCSFVAVL